MFSQPNSPIPEEVFTLLNVSASDCRVTPILGKGEANEVFLLEHRSDRFIVRLQPGERNLKVYRKEAWCMEQAALAGVPGARCIGIGGAADKAFMIQSALAATDGTEWTGDRVQLWRELGRHARKINSIAVRGHGWEMQDSDPGNFGNSWRDVVDWTIDYLFGDGFFHTSEILSKAQENVARARLEQMGSWAFEPKLSHGNLAPKNAMIDGNGTVFVIDWGTAGACRAPLQDLSDVLTWNWGNKYEQAFCEGYGISEEQFLAIKPELDILVLQRYLDSIRWAAEGKENWRSLDFVVHSRNRLHVIL